MKSLFTGMFLTFLLSNVAFAVTTYYPGDGSPRPTPADIETAPPKFYPRQQPQANVNPNAPDKGTNANASQDGTNQ